MRGREILINERDDKTMYVGVWVWGLFGVCAAIIMMLCVKILLMRKAAEEIREGISYRLRTDTNTLLDIASRDKAMCALAESLNEELRALRRQRQIYYQGNLALKEAVTNISHDIRTPLTAIRGYLELLEGEEKSENITRYLNVIEERTAVLSQLTEELFQYTVAAPIASSMATEDDNGTEHGWGQAERGAELSAEGSRSEGSGSQQDQLEADLGRLIEESVLASYGALIQKGIEPDVQLPEEKVKCRINGKTTRRILENILNNAMKYSDGDLYITLNEQGEVLFSNHALLMDAVQTGRLFDRFYTVENAKTATGLGLAIAKQLTEQMGGSITAWYEDGMLYLKLCFPLAEK